MKHSHYVVSVLQLSVASGKTTLATNLAGELSRFCRVALIDCHPVSRRAMKWAAKRAARQRSRRLIVQAAGTPHELLERAYRLRGDVDYLVLDGPNDPQMTKAAAAISELCLIPVLPLDDADAFCKPTISVLKEARELRRFRVRAMTVRQHAERSREPARVRTAKTLGTIWCERQAYSAALETGTIASDYGDASAREEVSRLVEEVSSLVSFSRSRRPV